MTFREEFPNYPIDAMPQVPESFLDQSWHNDTCPSFENAAARLSLWIDYPDTADREFADGKRFAVYRTDADGSFLRDMPIFESDDWTATLLFICNML